MFGKALQTSIAGWGVNTCYNTGVVFADGHPQGYRSPDASYTMDLSD